MKYLKIILWFFIAGTGGLAFARASYSDADFLTFALNSAQPMSMQKVEELFSTNPVYQASCHLTGNAFYVAPPGEKPLVGTGMESWADTFGKPKLPKDLTPGIGETLNGKISFQYQRAGRHGSELYASFELSLRETPLAIFSTAEPLFLPCDLDEKSVCRSFAGLESKREFPPEVLLDGEASSHIGVTRLQRIVINYVPGVTGLSENLIARMAVKLTAHKPKKRVGMLPWSDSVEVDPEEYLGRFLCELTKM